MLRRLFVAVPLAIIGAAWFYYISLPWPVLLLVRDPGSTALMRQRAAEARARGEELEIRKEWVPLDRISRRLQRAVIIAEDGNFHEHHGVDWSALREEFRYRGDAEFSWLDGGDRAALLASLRYYIANRDKVRGRSTITQQLAKNLYFSTARSPVRKLDEYFVARRLEQLLSKERILELYLNSVEWGPGVFGAEAAARHYFSRPAAELTADQAAALAATLPHPLTSNPNRRPGRMQWRKNLILSRMGATGPARTVPLDPAAPTNEPEDSAPDPIGAPVDPPAADTVAPADTVTPPDTSVRVRR